MQKRSREEMEKIKADFIANFADTPTAVLAEKWGMTFHYAQTYAYKLGLKKSELGKRLSLSRRMAKASIWRKNHPECYAEMIKHQKRFTVGVSMESIIGKERNEERKRKMIESRRKTVAEERKRLKYGLSPKTKLNITLTPRSITCFIHRLQKFGYIVDKNRMIAYFNDETRRCAVVESRKPGDRHYKYIKFMPTANCMTR